ncbi:MAG: menaquinone biosynthesis protein [Thermoguttaceae bacterium]
MQPSAAITSDDPKIRVGAVAYLNAWPLYFTLAQHAPHAELVVDLPSRLAEALAAGRLDVAMIPSIEYARNPGYTIISDACIACDGPVQSVKLYSRVPIEQIRTLALDEGSRTSVALTQILLRERYGVHPKTCRLPIGAVVDDVSTDAVLLIGDRGMLPAVGHFAVEWDLGQEWSQWTGLPFVFAVWIARPGVDLAGFETQLAAARDDGVTRFEQIARQAAPTIGVAEADCLTYLRDHLKFHFGPRQRQALELFYELAGHHGLAPTGVQLSFYRPS